MLTPTTENECFPTNEKCFDLALFQKKKELFLSEGKYRNLQPSTLQFYREHLLEFQRFLVNVNEALTSIAYPQLMEQMILSLLEREFSTHTIQGRIRTCRRLFRFLYPELSWPKLKVPLLRNKFPDLAPTFCFTADHLDTLLKQPDQNTFNGLRDYVILLVLLETGIRGFELSSLKISDIDWDDQTIRISVGKGQHVRYVPFQQTCLEGLREYIVLRGQNASDSHLWVTNRGTPLKRSAMLTMIRKRCRGIDLNEIRGSAQTFRHTMAKCFLLRGGSVFALQQILGHTTLDMTDDTFVCWMPTSGFCMPNTALSNIWSLESLQLLNRRCKIVGNKNNSPIQPNRCRNGSILLPALPRLIN